MAHAYQCDKCQTFYTDDPSNLVIRSVTDEILLQKDLCEKCKEEIINLFNQQDYRYKW